MISRFTGFQIVAVEDPLPLSSRPRALEVSLTQPRSHFSPFGYERRMPDADPMNVPEAVRKLNVALSLQYRSVLEHALLAGTMQGAHWQALEPLLSAFAVDELHDTRRMVQKIVAIGGDPTAAPAPFSLSDSPESSLQQLIEHELEVLAAFHAVIPDTGQEPRSEALEHRLEHLIMRKQEQVDTLRRALGLSGEA